MAAGCKAANRDIVYRIGSITKQLTGLMLLQLVDAGKVKLSDPVEKYFPDKRNVEGNADLAKPITLEKLATHRAGLSREPDDQKFLVGPVAEWEEIARSALPHVKYQFEPGRSYSNIGYVILGAALGRAAGQPYTDYVQQRILSPLGMRHTGFEPNAEMLAELAKGYVVVNDKGDPTFAAGELQTGRGYKVPNGALFTTIDDLAKFVSFEMGAGPEGVLDSAWRSSSKRVLIVRADRSGEGLPLAKALPNEGLVQADRPLFDRHAGLGLHSTLAAL